MSLDCNVVYLRFLQVELGFILCIQDGYPKMERKKKEDVELGGGLAKEGRVYSS